MTKNKDSLGFIFGYKETSKGPENNTFHVRFIEETSAKYPSKYKAKKDFWAQEILAGQSSSIYINPDLFIEEFKQEYLERKNYDQSEDAKYNYENRKHYFDYPITQDQYTALWAFSLVAAYNMLKRWENDTVLTDVLQKTIASEFPGKESEVLSLYNDFREKSSKIYDDEITACLAM